MAVDEFLNAGDGEGHFWVNDPEILIQADAHGLKARYNLLNAHPSLLHFELKKKTWTNVTIHVPLGSDQAIVHNISRLSLPRAHGLFLGKVSTLSV